MTAQRIMNKFDRWHSWHKMHL